MRPILRGGARLFSIRRGAFVMKGAREPRLLLVMGVRALFRESDRSAQFVKESVSLVLKQNLHYHTRTKHFKSFVVLD